MKRFTGPSLFLLGASFLITLGSFAVLPFMSVLLHERWGFGLGTVGAVLAVASLVQFGGGVVGAAVARRIGLRATMLVALAVRTAGFACFVPGLDRPWLAVVALFLVSAGAALYLPANKAYLVAGCAPERRPALLAASGSAFNAGIALGPPAAAPFVLTSPTTLFAGVAVLFAVVGVGHMGLPGVVDVVPGVAGEDRVVPEAAGEDRVVLGRTHEDRVVPDMAGEDRVVPARTHEDRVVPERAARPDWARAPFAYTLLSVLVFMYFQHYLALYAVPRTSAAFYASVLMAYALLLVVAQPLLAGWIAGLPYGRALRLGFAAMAVGTAVIGAGGIVGTGMGAGSGSGSGTGDGVGLGVGAGAGIVVGIVVGSLLLCFAETVLFLRNDLEALDRSRAPAATVFGRQRLAAGFGAFAAALFGGPLYGAAEQVGDAAVFWFAVSAQSVLLPVALWGASVRRGRARQRHAAAARS
ncbi:MFS transporter [Streptomyces sp. NPDC091292]|uniref:MFS transporter n=1 Tax=Streptomyces sp. NPDC091292 TaxID=3365991 RepID=UPI003805CE11